MLIAIEGSAKVAYVIASVAWQSVKLSMIRRLLRFTRNDGFLFGLSQRFLYSKFEWIFYAKTVYTGGDSGLACKTSKILIFKENTHVKRSNISPNG